MTEAHITEAILSEATRLFAARGAEATSLQAIADAVGVRKPSVLYHFPSKAAIHAAVLDGLLRRWNEVLPRLLRAASLSGVERFDALMGELLAFFLADPDRARLLVRELLDRPAETEAYLVRYVGPWLEVVGRALRAGQRSGEVRGDVDPEAFAVQVAFTVLLGIAASDLFGAVISPAGESRQRVLSEAVRAARAGLFCESTEVRDGELLRG
jgi:AcrR family transcriptional regulator